MKISSLGFCLALSSAPAFAQVAAPNVAPLPAPKLATVTPFITGLKEPQGLAYEYSGNFWVCDYGAGEILKFDREGKPLGKLATGLNGPSAIVSRVSYQEGQLKDVTGSVFVAERGANRVIRIDKTGAITPLGGEIPEPLGLARTGLDGLMVLSRTSSQVYRWENLHHYSFTSPLAIDAKGQWKLIYSAPPAEAPRLQFRWLADDSFRAGAHGDNDVFFASDEANQRVSMVSLSGRVAPFASGISNPSGLVIGPDKMFYVTNEANGGQLIRINNNGEKTIVAEKLGRPSSILFLDAKTALVSNRDGNIWKIALL